MTSNNTMSSSLQSEVETAVHLLDDWFDPIEVGLGDRVREFIQAMQAGDSARPPARATAATQGRVPRIPMARAVSPATGTVTDRGC